ncbi:MAG: glycoside hydrolase family 31 protein [Prevotella sp.]|jgi:alpha-glucosidase (family GH31 glycosyl hydrolase)|nr:glycoside hydrolase family 31 protein [Prevotella sp.]MCI1292279.1 glycoside hydrolase family 31 protein [Prevotella sp.]
MKKTLLACLILLLSAGSASAQESANVAYKDNSVRFTVISDGTLRMEYSPDGKFTDNRSFVAVDRQYPSVRYRVKQSKSKVVIQTDDLTLTYKKNSGKFAPSNLSVVSARKFFKFAWKPGMAQKGNLLGTYRTLDGCDGDMHGKDKLQLEQGLLATDGWTMIDDSKDFLFDNSSWPWVEKRRGGDSQDWYFMAYGHNYKKALKDFTLFAGKVPMPPKYAFGYWWSRYWSYSDDELRDMVGKFKTYNIPLDVLVIDMDWHYTEPGKGGWTGWTWNRKLFPDPPKLLDYLHSNQLDVTLNLHPAEGIAPYEEQYPQIARDMGIDPSSGQTIPWVASNKKLMTNVFKDILDPMHRQGVSFWWLDWQQWPYDKQVDSLSNTWWLNYVFFTHSQREGQDRPMLYHRWGGLGNHRYQIGFSGDTRISWKSLDFQPYFNSTASNVLYGYWSHDIGGHMGADHINPELFARWMQFGAVSAIMRTHTTKNGNLRKEPWVFNDTIFSVLRNTIIQRYRMNPYIYTMARKTYDTGISLCRPMYYDYPENREAYDFKDEYMFGDDMLVAPITAPMKDGYAAEKVWLPAGNDWYEWETGTLLKGGQTVTRYFKIDEYPIYIKAGAILPFLGHVKNLKGMDDDIYVNIFPGAEEGSFSLYEDNGNDKDYATDYARIPLSYRYNGNRLTVTIGARKGQYREMPSERQFYVCVNCKEAPESVTVGGEKADYSYCGDSLKLTVKVPVTSCSAEKQVVITYPQGPAPDLDGFIGTSHRLRDAVVGLKYKNAGIVLNDGLGTMASTGMSLTYYPEKFDVLIQAFNDNLKNLPAILKDQKLSDADCQWFLHEVLGPEAVK